MKHKVGSERTHTAGLLSILSGLFRCTVNDPQNCHGLGLEPDSFQKLFLNLLI